MCFALFFQYWEKWEAKEAWKIQDRIFIKIDKIYEYSTAQVSCLSFPRGAVDALVTGSMGSIRMK